MRRPRPPTSARSVHVSSSHGARREAGIGPGLHRTPGAALPARRGAVLHRRLHDHGGKILTLMASNSLRPRLPRQYDHDCRSPLATSRSCARLTAATARGACRWIAFLGVNLLSESSTATGLTAPRSTHACRSGQHSFRTVGSRRTVRRRRQEGLLRRERVVPACRCCRHGRAPRPYEPPRAVAKRLADGGRDAVRACRSSPSWLRHAVPSLRTRARTSCELAALRRDGRSPRSRLPVPRPAPSRAVQPLRAASDAGRHQPCSSLAVSTPRAPGGVQLHVVQAESGSPVSPARRRRRSCMIDDHAASVADGFWIASARFVVRRA